MEAHSLPTDQLNALKQIAIRNRVTPETLVLLAVEALIAEARRHQDWLPIPEDLRLNPGQNPPSFASW